jgi:hypothetical protein
VLSLRSQFFQSLLHFSSQAKERSTTHRCGMTAKVCSSLRLATLVRLVLVSSIWAIYQTRGQRLLVIPLQLLSAESRSASMHTRHQCYALTGSRVKNKKYGYIYFYYWCSEPGCHYVHIRAEQVHQDFRDLLKAFRVDAHLGEDFVASLQEKWQSKNGDSVVVVTKLKRELQTAQKRKQNLLMKYLDGDSAIQHHFEAMQERLDTEIATLNGQIAESEMARATFDDLLEFTRKMPSDLDQIWTQAPLELQQKVQNLLFQGGLIYDPETGILNQDNAHTFNKLQHFLAGNLEMVDPEGFEPPTTGL